MSLFFTSLLKKTISERSLIPIVTAEVLLSSNKYKKTISAIRQTVTISDELFDILYQSLINNFVEFVQLLPTNKDASLGSLIDEGLSRALFAMQFQKDDAEEQQPDPLLAYTLFSAALLFDICFAVNNRTVIISKKDGSFVEEWIPNKGRMHEYDGDYYRIRPCITIDETLSRNSTSLLAKQLIPSIGFDWIAKNPNILNIWITLLNEDKKTTNNLKSYLERAHKKTLEEPHNDSFPTKSIKIIDPDETSLAEDFIEWLRKGLSTKKIDINTYDSDIHVIENGLFLETPEIIQKFCDQSSKNIKLEQVFAQLKKIGFISSCETNQQLATYTYTNLDNIQPMPFIQQLGKQNQKTNTPQQPLPQKNLLEQNKRNETRRGIEVFLPCFIFALMGTILGLSVENGFIPSILKKAKLKKKIRRLKRLKLRRLRFRQLDRIIAETLRLRLYVQNKIPSHYGEELKKWLKQLKIPLY